MSAASVSEEGVNGGFETPHASGCRQRLYLDGMPRPVGARLVARSDAGLQVTQRLPFLRVGSLVRDDQQRPARIAGVSLAMEAEVPHLVLDLVYEPATPNTRCYRVDHAPARMERAGDASSSGYEQTLVFRTHVGQPDEPSRAPAHTRSELGWFADRRGRWTQVWTRLVWAVRRLVVESAWIPRARRAQSH